MDRKESPRFFPFSFLYYHEIMWNVHHINVYKIKQNLKLQTIKCEKEVFMASKNNNQKIPHCDYKSLLCLLYNF